MLSKVKARFRPPSEEVISVVLRDPEGRIVATWDGGRRWTPSESTAYTERGTSEEHEEREQEPFIYEWLRTAQASEPH